MTRANGWPSERSLDGGIDEVPVPGVSGRMWLCGKHVVGPDPLAALVRAGAETIVCLNEEHELVDRYPDYVELLRTDRAGLVIWRPVPDLSALSLYETVAVVEEVGQRLWAGRRVLVHCGAGIGRAGTLAVGVLLSCGIELAEARAIVAAARPNAGPEAGGQERVVDELADWYRGRRTSSG